MQLNDRVYETTNGESAFSSAYRIITELAADFESGFAHFTSPGYSEASLRQDFLDKFFEALGWDVDHKEQKNPY